MNEKFTKNAEQVIYKAEELAQRTGGIIGTEHLLYAMTLIDSGVAYNVLSKYGVTTEKLEQFFERGENYGQASMSARVKKLMLVAYQLSSQTGMGYIGTEHMLYALLVEYDSYAVRMLNSLNVDIRSMKKDLYSYLVNGDNTNGNESDGDDAFYGAMDEQYQTQNDVGRSKQTDNMGIDLTELAKKGKLDPVIGREDEIERIIQILSRRTKNNPVLIGEPGVGKSAIVEGLAQAIVSGNVPELLKGKRIFSLDVAGMLAGTKYRGEFEERLKNTIKEIKSTGNTIIFIDEIHNIVGAGATEGGSLDAANILKPMLARGELQTIGATTIDEYRKYIEKDAALERRFQPVMVEPPSVENTIEILKGLRDKYEAHHKIKITDEAIKAAAVYSDRYITDRFLPDKAIDLIDEAASKKRIEGYIAPNELKEKEKELDRLIAEKTSAVKRQEYEKADEIYKQEQKLVAEIDEEKQKWNMTRAGSEQSIGEEEIAEIVSKWTSIPVVKMTEDESQRLINLEATLHERVIGQDDAVKSIAAAIKRARAGLKDVKRPIGSFIFLGPTGVGKTELSKALAEALFGDENLLIRVDMSEYMEKHNVSKLIGSAPGYVGYDEGGQLTEKVRRKPYSVILFDEIEKAHPDIFNILLQIMDDGRLTDSHGRTVSFKNTVIIMTSNVGASEIGKMSLGFNNGNEEKTYEDMRERQFEALKRTFKPEFINRVDDIILFHRLNKDELGKITEIMYANLKKQLKERNIEIEITDKAKDRIIEIGYDAEYGARPLRRAIEKNIENALSEKILTSEIKSGDSVTVDYNGKEFTVNSLSAKEDKTKNGIHNAK